MRKRSATMLCAMALAALPLLAQDAALTTVTMGDGSSVLLRSWQLVHDVQTWPKGQPPSMGGGLAVPGTELLLAKKRLTLAGHTLEPVYAAGSFAARQVALVAPDGKRSVLKVEMPARELLTPDLDKDTMSMARSLDLVGETLTGTRRSFCLLSFTALVSCADAKENQVVRVEFAP